MSLNTNLIARPFATVVITSCLALSGLGCGGGADWQADTAEATGTVLINGQPAQGAIVTLHPTGESVDVRESKPWGVVQADGTYALRTYKKDDGAPPGEYVATVVWRENPSIPGSPDQLRGAYESPEKSTWKFTIQAGDTELPPIEIADAKLTKPKSRRSKQPSPFEAMATDK